MLAPPSHTITDGDHSLHKKAFSHIAFQQSRGEESRLFMLRSLKTGLALLAPPSHMTTGGDLVLIQKALRNSQIRESCGEDS
jgi:hypothetical protein